MDINGNSNRKAVTITHPATLDGNSELFGKKLAKKLIMAFWEKARKKPAKLPKTAQNFWNFRPEGISNLTNITPACKTQVKKLKQAHLVYQV